MTFSPLIRYAVAALAAAVAGSVAAQESSKFYAGVGLGLTEFDSDHERIVYGDTPPGWQLYGGWQTLENMAVELAVERLAAIEVDDVLGSGVDRLRISADVSSATLRGVFSLSLEEVLRRHRKISVFGIVGLVRLLEERDVTELRTSRSTSVSERDTALVLGAGATFDFGSIRLRTYVQSADREGGDLNSLGAAAEFRF
jgi:Outer membrane protein beta-barrel domain